MKIITVVTMINSDECKTDIKLKKILQQISAICKPAKIVAVKEMSKRALHYHIVMSDNCTIDMLKNWAGKIYEFGCEERDGIRFINRVKGSPIYKST
ncbi:hypothetical protein EDD70_1044 [Hydrogenoanaerobacterium saccharovorans]|uniref:Uncharacterized protein n=1 Tax=Hydrogenoanaerobacterium saccharovorans TaxID=474960 RepID=A0A1H8A1G5_9FIRM|nr:hypothetical protein [Hydrogenoanaerobacterium saccharovorans]RPF48229.1 hypothetical protein EDD70_1044 [Hydrogenoanaerobacterium saccharovorans]SEM64441.1 hypothetical protein SAMN05216180_1047 [Hydrogenoanaerobacterium saccharovorans]